jgi:hypothetical protein
MADETCTCASTTKSENDTASYCCGRSCACDDCACQDCACADRCTGAKCPCDD